MSSDELATIAQKAARGGLFLFIGNAASTAILAIGAIIVARLLGPSDYGQYTLALVVPFLLVSLSDVGMTYAIIRLPARLRADNDHARANKLIRRGFLLKLAVSMAAFILCYVAAAPIATLIMNRPQLAPFIQLASIIIVFQAVFEATSYSFIGLDLMQYSAGLQIVQAVLKGTLAPALVLTGLGISGAVLGYVIALIAAALPGALLLFARHARSPSRPAEQASSELRQLLGYGLPLYLASIFLVVLSQYQNIVLPRFASNVEIGNFSATWNFTTLMLVLVYPITMAMFPMFSKMDPEKQRSDLARGFVLAVKYTSMLMIPASVMVMLFSRDLIYLTYGSGYTFAPQYLVLLSALYLATGIGYLIVGSFLTGVAQTGTILRMSALTLVIYLPLGPAFTWLGGPRGLLLAYLVSNTIATTYGLKRIAFAFDARPDLKTSGRILLAALGAAVPTLLLTQLDGLGPGVLNLITGGLLYLAVYLTLMPMLRAASKQDIINLRTILGKTRIVAFFTNPVFDYEDRLISAMEQK